MRAKITLEGERIEYRPVGLNFHNSAPLMAEVIPGAGGNYLHRSIDQLQRSMNERGALLHDYKQFADLRNTIVADYTIKANLNLNNNNILIDNRNNSSASHNNSNNQSPELIEQKHSHQIQQQQQQQQQLQQQQHFSSPPTPPTATFTITDAQMNDAKVNNQVKSVISVIQKNTTKNKVKEICSEIKKQIKNFKNLRVK